jgi:rhodanese-related sulfurtransferase
MSRNYTVYAVDFEGTLCKSIYPGIGAPNMGLILHLIKRRSQGNKVILWTCRCGQQLTDAVEFCRKHGLEFDAVNENLPELMEIWGNDPRKVAADVYIDDKAVMKPKYHVPYRSTQR